MAKILVIEDDEDMGAMVVRALREDKHTVEHTANGRAGLELLLLSQYDVVVLDWQLPELSGMEILQEFRSRGGKASVLMLTGKGSIDNKETGFNSGADDYLTKPVDLREVVLRVRNLLRRPAQFSTSLLKHEDIELDFIKHKITKRGAEIYLAPRDFALLEFLMRHPDDVFSAESLIARIWQTDAAASGEAVRMAISRIRKVIDDEHSEASLIESLPRIGYKLRKLK